MTQQPHPPAELVRQRQKRARIFLLRGAICVAAGGLMVTEGLGSAGLGSLALLLAFAWSNVFLVFVPTRLLRSLKFELILGGADLVVVALGIHLAESGRSSLLVSFLLMILVVALGDNRLRAVGGTAAVVSMHAWFFLNGPAAGRGPQQLTLQILLLSAVGLYYGYLVSSIHTARKKAEIERLTYRELSVLLEILDSVTASLDVREVSREIVSNINKVVPSLRCSLLRIDASGSRCQVLASHDNPDLDGLEVDLSLYPEIREAISTREPVLVRDVETDPVMAGVADRVLRCGIDTIHVAPVAFELDQFGTLLLKTSRAGEGFSSTETRFCEAMARASANALKHAVLHRRLADESRRHQRTSGELDRILSDCPAAIICTDVEGRLSEINAAAESLLGYSKDEIWGHPASALFGPGWEEGAFARVREQGLLAAMETRLRRKDGGAALVEMTAAILKGEGGEPAGTIWMGRDVTELAEARRRLTPQPSAASGIPEEPAEDLDPGASRARREPGGHRILLVDDEPTILDLLEIVLGEAGYLVDRAADGAEALTKVAATDYDLVVTDVRMPKVDGIDLFRSLRESHPVLAERIIFISGDLGDKGTASFLQELNATVFPKPVEVLKFLEAVERSLALPQEPAAV